MRVSVLLVLIAALLVSCRAWEPAQPVGLDFDEEASLDLMKDGPLFSEINLLGNLSVADARAGVVKAAEAMYAKRASIHYTMGPKRWSGIESKTMPPGAPLWSDCSSSSTWAYWTVIGKGADILNGQSWKAGYTGTLIGHGKRVDQSNAQPGDLVFYGSGKVSHVAIYIGGGMVISHGSDPVIKAKWNYRKDYHHTRRYL